MGLLNGGTRKKSLRCPRCGQGAACDRTGDCDPNGRPAPVANRVRPHNAGHDWCACGCLIRNGRCTNSTCKK